MNWRRAVPEDRELVKSFISYRETWATGFTNRAFGKKGELNCGKKGLSGLYLHNNVNGKLDAAILFCWNGTIFPVLAETMENGGEEAVECIKELLSSKTIKHYKPYLCVGAKDHVEALQNATSWYSNNFIIYDSMARNISNQNLLLKANNIMYFDSSPILIRQAVLSDLRALYPIASNYQKTEVLTKAHKFIPTVCIEEQKNSIQKQIVFVAEHKSEIIARAQTNAQGFCYKQIGGVYVMPNWRNLGIGKQIVSCLVNEITTRGKSSSLFVKKTNTFARNLYTSIGFKIIRDYYVSYIRI